MSVRFFLLCALVLPAAAQTKSFSVIMRMQSLVSNNPDGAPAHQTFDRREIYAANGNWMGVGIDPITEGVGEIRDFQKMELIAFDNKAKIYKRTAMGPYARSIHVKTAAHNCWYYFPSGPCTDGPVLQGFGTKLVKPGPDTFEYVVRELDWFPIRRENRNRGKLLSFHAAIEVKLLGTEPVFQIPEGFTEEPDDARFETRGREARGQTVTPEMQQAIRDQHARRAAAFMRRETK